jgi:hypothetical protein
MNKAVGIRQGSYDYAYAPLTELVNCKSAFLIEPYEQSYLDTSSWASFF